MYVGHIYVHENGLCDIARAIRRLCRLFVIVRDIETLKRISQNHGAFILVILYKSNFREGAGNVISIVSSVRRHGVRPLMIFCLDVTPSTTIMCRRHLSLRAFAEVTGAQHLETHTNDELAISAACTTILQRVHMLFHGPSLPDRRLA